MLFSLSTLKYPNSGDIIGSILYCSRDPEDTFSETGSSPAGLTEEEASLRLERFGKNLLEKARGPGPASIVIHQFTDPLIYILLVAALITIFLQDWIDTAIILLVVLINAVIGFTQEFRAEKAIDALISLSAPKASVMRDRKVKDIDSENLVPGDVVLLSSGTKVPADMRLFEAYRLEADESALTGESVSVFKQVKKIEGEGLTTGDMTNCAFMGTLILSGRGKGVVTATGAKTQLGGIGREVGHIKRAATPLQVQLTKMSKTIGLAIVGVSIVAIVAGILIGESFRDMVLTGIALAVGAIPEGLPIVVTITLAIGVKSMARRNAIVRRLPAVETLGGTTVIASDKTGTMTQNEMTVRKVFAGGLHYDVTGVGYSPEGNIVPVTSGTKDIALKKCLLAGALANESGLAMDEKTGEYQARGDPTEVSLIVSAMKYGILREDALGRMPLLDEIPFESDRLYMATLHDCRDDGANAAFIKGAPDRVLQMCDRAMDADGSHVSIDTGHIASVNASLGREGYRVLAMAYKEFPLEKRGIEPADVEYDAVFLGLQAMYDPPRVGVYEAIRQSKSSGIRVIMVTGDHQTTALAIAKKLEIVGEEDSTVITGNDMEMLSDDRLDDIVSDVSVYSRVSPLHKLRIVRALIGKGEVVAVTGDGVNDTPALKAAHIGVAMGKSGTDAAKETAEIVITDDNFASIVTAVKEGRVVFTNIRKVTLFLLSSGLGQVLLILTGILMKLPLPLLPAQIIWMNLVTNGLQDMAMAFEPAEKDIERQPPRKLSEPVISRLMIERLAVIGITLAVGTLAVFLWQLRSGEGLDKARTAALTTMVLFQLFNVFNARSETRSAFMMNPLANPFLFFSVIASIPAQLAMIYLEPLQRVFSTIPLTIIDWAVIVPVSFTVIIVVEIDKAIRRYLARRRPPKAS